MWIIFQGIKDRKAWMLMNCAAQLDGIVCFLFYTPNSCNDHRPVALISPPIKKLFKEITKYDSGTLRRCTDLFWIFSSSTFNCIQLHILSGRLERIHYIDPWSLSLTLDFRIVSPTLKLSSCHFNLSSSVIASALLFPFSHSPSAVGCFMLV